MEQTASDATSLLSWSCYFNLCSDVQFVTAAGREWSVCYFVHSAFQFRQIRLHSSGVVRCTVHKETTLSLSLLRWADSFLTPRLRLWTTSQCTTYPSLRIWPKEVLTVSEIVSPMAVFHWWNLAVGKPRTENVYNVMFIQRPVIAYIQCSCQSLANK
jgi:hypothetical protein